MTMFIRKRCIFGSLQVKKLQTRFCETNKMFRTGHGNKTVARRAGFKMVLAISI